MINFFNSVLNFFQTILDLITYLVSGFAQLFVMIPKAVAMLTYSIGFLPSVLLAFASVAITLSIFYLLIGR